MRYWHPGGSCSSCGEWSLSAQCSQPPSPPQAGLELRAARFRLARGLHFRRWHRLRLQGSGTIPKNQPWLDKGAAGAVLAEGPPAARSRPGSLTPGDTEAPWHRRHQPEAALERGLAPLQLSSSASPSSEGIETIERKILSAAVAPRVRRHLLYELGMPPRQRCRGSPRSEKSGQPGASKKSVGSHLRCSSAKHEGEAIASEAEVLLEVGAAARSNGGTKLHLVRC
mmetsp:Transcript_8429/g.19928  ORF Transcript_8429/g.19928 Transcript_8429/m.19928 type:complete len:226 (-) Transcript_8429:57-734(-)